MKINLRSKFISRCLLTFSLFVFNNQVFAQAGTIDTSFGSGGTTFTNLSTTDNNLFPRRAAIQSDGKAVGLFDTHLNVNNGFTAVVIRYNFDGSLDGGFASGGVLLTNWNTPSGGYGSPFGMTLQTVGGEEKILLAGSYGNDATLRVDRYDSDGTPDETFGSNGTVIHNTGGYALAITTQPDGKILLADDVGILTRLNGDGTLDSTFGSGGTVQLNGVRGYALAVQSSGRILLGGIRQVKGKSSFAVLRFNPNGTPDDGGRGDSTPGDAFGVGGVTPIEFFSGGSVGNDSRNDWLKIDAAGKILFTGAAATKNSSNDQFAIARLTANGQYDSTFSGDGKATVDLTTLRDSPRSIAIQSNGKIVLTGIAGRDPATASNLGMTRLNADGSLDTGFGVNGIVVKDFSSTAEWNHAGLIQYDALCPCEKIVTVGSAELSGIDYALAVRYLLQ